ncbi:MAG TPA: hypothetical protein VIV60_08620 [Polyangiaceae bacterium]
MQKYDSAHVLPELGAFGHGQARNAAAQPTCYRRVLDAKKPLVFDPVETNGVFRLECKQVYT